MNPNEERKEVKPYKGGVAAVMDQNQLPNQYAFSVNIAPLTKNDLIELGARTGEKSPTQHDAYRYASLDERAHEFLPQEVVSRWLGFCKIRKEWEKTGAWPADFIASIGALGPSFNVLLLDKVMDKVAAEILILQTEYINKTPKETNLGNNNNNIAVMKPYFTDGKICRTCSKEKSAEVKLSVCSKCKSVFYCSRSCQTEDWHKHKKDCKTFELFHS